MGRPAFRAALPSHLFLVSLFQDSTLNVAPISRVGGYFIEDEVRPPVVDPGCCTLYAVIVSFIYRSVCFFSCLELKYTVVEE